MNPGGVRADFTFGQISGGEQPGQVTYGEAFVVQPFGNLLVTLDMTGAQLEAVLEQQFVVARPGGRDQADPRRLQRADVHLRRDRPQPGPG